MSKFGRVINFVLAFCVFSLPGCTKDFTTSISVIYDLGNMTHWGGRWRRARVEVSYLNPVPGWEENKGQISDERVKYFAQMSWGYVYLTDTGIHFLSKLYKKKLKLYDTPWGIHFIQKFPYRMSSLEVSEASVPLDKRYIIKKDKLNQIHLEYKYKRLSVRFLEKGFKMVLDVSSGDKFVEEIELRGRTCDLSFCGRLVGMKLLEHNSGEYERALEVVITNDEFEYMRSVWEVRHKAEIKVLEGDVKVNVNGTSLVLTNMGEFAKVRIEIAPVNEFVSIVSLSGDELLNLKHHSLYFIYNVLQFLPESYDENISRGYLNQFDVVQVVKCGYDLKPWSSLIITGTFSKNSSYCPLKKSGISVAKDSIYLSASSPTKCVGNYPISSKIIISRGYEEFEPYSIEDLLRRSTVEFLTFRVSTDLERLIASLRVGIWETGTSPMIFGRVSSLDKSERIYLHGEVYTFSPKFFPNSTLIAPSVPVIPPGYDRHYCGNFPTDAHYFIALVDENLTRVKSSVEIPIYYTFAYKREGYATVKITDYGVYFLQWDYNADYPGLKEKFEVPIPRDHAWILLFDPELKKLKGGVTVSDLYSMYAMTVSPKGDVYVAGRGSKRYIFPAFDWIPKRERNDTTVYTFIARLDRDLKNLKGIYLFKERDLTISRIYYIDGRVYALGYKRQIVEDGKVRRNIEYKSFRLYMLDEKLKGVEKEIRIPQVKKYRKRLGTRLEPLPERLVDVGDGICLVGYVGDDKLPVSGVNLKVPEESGGKDIFVAFFSKGLDRRGSIIQIGGNGEEVIGGIAADEKGRVYLYGFTHSEDFNVNEVVYGVRYSRAWNPFLVKISPFTKQQR